MDITYLGQASFRIKGKTATVVLDPYSDDIGIKFPKVEADIVTVSHEHYDHNAASLVGGEPFVVRGPGEYEVKGVEILGVDSFHDEKGGAERGKNAIYNLKIDKINVCHLGDLGQNSLTNEQVEEIGNVDLLLIPVGGHFTIDASVAAKVASQLEPKIIIPMHFRDPQTKITELEGAEKFLKEMGKENVQPVSKFSVHADKFPEETQVVLMQKG
ncbi:MAG TPA: MBL fold metallo-hydrolase [Candidatus Nanoarchaeia archaeon]|nr:hypothetical protein [uncultured archaeon]